MIRWGRLAPFLIAAAGTLVYCNSLTGRLLLDDFGFLSDSPKLHHLAGIWQYLAVTSRPVVDLTLAVNYALGGLAVAGYHLVNLAIHIGAGLALFGVIRRTLLGPALGVRYSASGASLALVATLLWLVHPLQTQSVTYIIQRAESLMGLFYLLTLYAAIRWMGEPKLRHWRASSILFCILGMGCKPVMATAPVLVLLYDRTFRAGSFREAWRQHSTLYVGLAASWVVLGLLLTGKGDDYLMGAGFGLQGMNAVSYAAMQPKAILHYLALSFWPHPLILDYGWPIANTLSEVLLPMLGVGALIGGTLWALGRRFKAGFLGGWFFLILAPSSSIIPLADLVFEHRMYLSLAAVAVGVVLVAYEAGQRLPEALKGLKPALAGILAFGVITALGVGTYLRNEDYRDPVDLWQKNVAQRPGNARAHNNLAKAFTSQGSLEEALTHFRKAIALTPGFAIAHHNMGIVLGQQGRIEEALQSIKMAIHLGATPAEAHLTLGQLYAQLGKTSLGIQYLRSAIKLNPASFGAHNALGIALSQQGKLEEAILCYEEAIRLNPRYARGYNNLGNTLARSGKRQKAIAAYDKALRLQPGWVQVQRNRAKALRETQPSPKMRVPSDQDS